MRIVAKISHMTRETTTVDPSKVNTLILRKQARPGMFPWSKGESVAVLQIHFDDQTYINVVRPDSDFNWRRMESLRDAIEREMFAGRERLVALDPLKGTKA